MSKQATAEQLAALVVQQEGPEVLKPLADMSPDEREAVAHRLDRERAVPLTVNEDGGRPCGWG